MKTKSSLPRSAAAIDVGSEKLYVGVPGQKVRIFDTFTASLHQLRDYLQSRQITTVAMEATGVYWWPVYRVLEEAGFEVCVVNGAHVKNVPGRKTDVADSQWLAELHSKGLLRAGFVPPAQIRKLRTFARLRQEHVANAAKHILHMQKALDLMNLKIHDVFSDTTGVSSLRMIRAILNGVRDPEMLLALCEDSILKRKRDRLLLALQGTWDPEQLFALDQAVAAWDFYHVQMSQCDREVKNALDELAVDQPQPPVDQKPTRKPLRPNAPAIDNLGLLLHRITGVDLTALPCLTDYSQMLLVSEVGTDMSPWPTAAHFVSWLGLSPGKRDSGKRRRKQKRFRGIAGKLFCVIARSLAQSKHLALAGFYRRLRATRGGQVANIAAARKLAILFYNALKHGLAYVEQGLQAYEQKYREQSKKRFMDAAKRFGLVVTEQPLAT
jgi:transposase